MDFRDWYERHGYAKYDEQHQGAGVSQCAKDIGATPHHVRALLREEGNLQRRNPSGVLIRLMQFLDENIKKDN